MKDNLINFFGGLLAGVALTDNVVNIKGKNVHPGVKLALSLASYAGDAIVTYKTSQIVEEAANHIAQLQQAQLLTEEEEDENE